MCEVGGPQLVKVPLLEPPLVPCREVRSIGRAIRAISGRSVSYPCGEMVKPNLFTAQLCFSLRRWNDIGGHYQFALNIRADPTFLIDTAKDLYQNASTEMVAFMRSQIEREISEQEIRTAWKIKYSVCAPYNRRHRY